MERWIRHWSEVGILALAYFASGSMGLLAAGMIATPALPGAWLAWWLGNATGVLLLTPLLLAWGSPRTWRRPLRPAEGMLLVLTLLLASRLVFPVQMAVNLSGRQFRDPQLPELVARTLERHAIPPGCLELEITKSCVMTDARESIERITQGCTQIQGHYFCPPLPARGCSHFLATRPRLALD
jgi:hypothetical protein